MVKIQSRNYSSVTNAMTEKRESYETTMYKFLQDFIDNEQVLTQMYMKKNITVTHTFERQSNKTNL